MLVKSLHVKNLLTFDTFDLDLDGKTHTIVGPNGAGKSNIVRVFDLVGKAVDWASQGGRDPAYIQAAQQVLQSFGAAHHHGASPDTPAVVRLELAMTTPAERERLVSFLRAAILSTLLDELNRDPDTAVKLSAWVMSEITEDTLAPLFTGTFVLHHVGMPHLSWDVSYEFEYGGCNYSWLMANRGFSQSIVPSTSPQSRLDASPYRQLKETLLGLPQTTTQPITLPNPLPSFNFGSLCPASGEAIASINVHTGTGSFDVQLLPCRRASELLGIPAISMGQQTFQLSHVLSILLGDGIITLGEQFRGLGIGGTPPQQAGPYSWEALVSPVRSRAPWVLPLRLFELKNGTPAERMLFQRIQDTFAELAPGRSFDVKFQAVDLAAMNPSTIGTGQLALYPPGAANEPQLPQPLPGAVLSVVVDRTVNDALHPSDLPIQLHGGGTWEALVVSEALVEAQGRFVILDEPALTLHPTWQRALRSRIQNAQGSFLVITHSANLVPMNSEDHLTRLIRVENESGSTMLHRLRGLSDDDVSRIVKEFSLSTDAVSLLFARGVVLLEGETELGTLPKWFEQCASAGSDMRPADLDLAFYSVGGDLNFRTLVRVMNALAIPWVLICDGAAFDIQKRNKRNPHVFGQVLSAGVDIEELRQYMNSLDDEVSKRVMDAQTFDHEKALGRAHGVFTLARGWKTADKTAGTSNEESFEVFLEAVTPGKLDEAEEEVGDSKVRKGLWVAENTECPSEVNDLYKSLIEVLRQRGLAS
jgi:hypothetical protein